jgi:Ca2+-binding RTX toxin-like protein
VGGRLFQDELVRLDLKTGKRRILSFGTGAEFSHDGRSIAFSSGGECRDREGIYVMHVDGTQRKRLTNDCAIRGTPRADTLHGTPLADVLLGLGGNDRLFASDPGYVGDTLDGGPGNDVLVGGLRQDTLYGGPGNDTLSGGPSGDTLVGGPGRDRLYGQGGRDTIYAVDGQRDTISCGTNGYGKHGQDVVYADRVDAVASDCEIVHRS